MKTATIALVVRTGMEIPSLLEVLSDENEIAMFEQLLMQNKHEPMSMLQRHRDMKTVQENEFGDYVEEIVSHPYAKKDIKDYGLRWLKSRMKIEEFQRSELEAAKIIGDYAYRIFLSDPDMVDFSLQGPSAAVRVKVFILAALLQASTGKVCNEGDKAA
ncbi:MAG: hypothetical protein AABZ06_06170 [Bdellovibrionota bacterium]